MRAALAFAARFRRRIVTRTRAARATVAAVRAFEAFGRFHMHFAADHGDRLLHGFLDRAQIGHFQRSTEGNRLAVAACAGGPANAVHVVFRHVGQVVVIDMRHFRNIETTGSDIGRDQDLDFPRAELRQGALALVLRFVAVDGDHREAPFFQQFRQLIRAMLGAVEHNGQLFGVLGNIFRQQRRLIALRGEVNALFDLLRRLARRGDLHLDRIGQIGRGQLFHLFRHCGREQQGLALLRDQARDFAQRVDEADVEHLVGLVEHEVFGFRQDQRAAFQQVQKAARSRDENINAFRELLGLHIDRGPANNAEDAHGRADRESGEVVVDLGGQFAGRREDQRAHGFGRGAFAVGEDLGDHRQAEGRRFAGAGLCEAENIAAFHAGRDALRLDRGRLGEAHCGEVFDHERREAEVFEVIHEIYPEWPRRMGRGPKAGSTQGARR